jgi:nucleoside-diphosphate-sugar epimerase
MIVGNGMLANAFKKYENDENIVIYASGVSNSSEKNDSEYNREFELLKQNISNKKLVYFSTISIFDPSLIDSKYTKHKRAIEEYIRNNCESFIIFRLPIIIGNSGNKNIFFNFIKNKLLNNETIQIRENSFRYIIDLDDLIEELPYFIDNFNRQIFNVAFENRDSTKNIVLKMKEILQSESLIETINEINQSNYLIDNFFFLKETKKRDENYNNLILKKYLENAK